MAYRVGPRVLASFLLVTSVVWAMGCNDEEDDCIQCCSCQYDGDPVAYKPDAPGDCSTCEEQCQVLADNEHLGQKFDTVKRISCPD